MKIKTGRIIKKTYLKELIAVLFVLSAVYFFKREQKELHSIIPTLASASILWVIAGVGLTFIYLLLQGQMYVFSFNAINKAIPIRKAVFLFLKRNLLSVFLPAGGISSMLYVPRNLKEGGLSNTEIYQASIVYSVTGILSVILLAVPVAASGYAMPGNPANLRRGLAITFIFLFTLLYFQNSIRKKNGVYRILTARFPILKNGIDTLFSVELNFKNFLLTIFISLIIEFTGIFHLLIAMYAIGSHPVFEACLVGYLISTMLMIISPFLRGLGAVEVSLAYILSVYNYNAAEALSITILYRVFEFWAPLAGGIISFISKGRHIIARLFPAILICLLGTINIISVLTPPLKQRIKILQYYLPAEAIHASDLLVLLSGIILLITSFYLLKGVRNAWLISFAVSAISVIMNITKALDWEEASLGLLVCLILIATHRQYRAKSNQKLMSIGFVTVTGVFLVVILYGFIGFYFLDIKHFGVDFTWSQSIRYTISTFLLLTSDSLHPITRYGVDFLLSIKILSILTWLFALYTVIKPFIVSNKETDEWQLKAVSILNKYGTSAMDYFKIYPDKLIWLSERYESFIAYRTAGGFAVVLEEPVCDARYKIPVIREFEKYCVETGLKPLFYRLDEENLFYFTDTDKKKILIGQEGILTIQNFSLVGKDKKSLRNGLNSLEKKGYKPALKKAPLSDDLVSALEKLSGEWLTAYRKKETWFSQGIFQRNLIKDNDVLIVNDEKGNIVSFLNIIPDYAQGECTYDLIRKGKNAPSGCMDLLIVELIEYAKREGFKKLNLGMVPLSGITDPENTAEQIAKFAYERISNFNHYRGLRDFKEKFADHWKNKYIIYENDFDLIQIPHVLNKVMRPDLL